MMIGDKGPISAAANAFSWCVGRPFLAAYSSAASSNVRSGRKRMLIRARFSPATDLLRTLRVTSRPCAPPPSSRGVHVGISTGRRGVNVPGPTFETSTMSNAALVRIATSAAACAAYYYTFFGPNGPRPAVLAGSARSLPPPSSATLQAAAVAVAARSVRSRLWLVLGASAAATALYVLHILRRHGSRSRCHLLAQSRKVPTSAPADVSYEASTTAATIRLACTSLEAVAQRPITRRRSADKEAVD